MFKPADIAREFVYPANNVAVALSLSFIFVMLKLAIWGGILGLFLLALMLPMLLHYQMRILDARTRGTDPGPLQVEDMMWLHHPWSLFQLVHIAIIVYVLYFTATRFGLGAMLAAAAILAAVIPASLAILAVTRSPLESLNVFSIGRLIDTVGTPYWILPSYFVAASWLQWWIGESNWPRLAADFVVFYVNIVFYALIGAVMRPHRLHDEVDIHDPVEPDKAVLDEKLRSERTRVLNHAYGFISRDNRAGGFRHIENWLREDPDPRSAWQWFFEQMLRWENKFPALLFGQSYLHQLLEDGDRAGAVKVMVRCHHEDASFKPIPDDIPQAIDAAEQCGNQELADRLRSRV